MTLETHRQYKDIIYRGDLIDKEASLADGEGSTGGRVARGRERKLYSFNYLIHKKQIIVEMRNQQPTHKQTVAASLKYSPLKPHNRQHPLAALIATISKDQQHAFSTLSQKCSAVEYALAAVEVLTAQVGERVQRINESREAAMLGSLKIKQSEFIIGELRTSLAKQTRKEERLLEDLAAEKKRGELLRQENCKLQAKNAALAEKAATLDATMRKKSELLESSNNAIQKIRSQQENENRNRNKSFTSKQSLSVMRSNEQYGQLEAKIEQLEREFNTEVQKLVSRNNDLSLELRKYKENSIEMGNANKALRKEMEQAGRRKYEVEIKAKQEAIQMGELEQAYSKLVEKSNNSEIMLHKQLQEYKVKEVDLRNEFKKEKKTIKTWFSSLAEHINTTKYYFTANQLKDQVEELKKLYDKTLKKKLENSSRELDYYQAEHKKAKMKADELEQRLSQMEKPKPTVSSARDLEGEMEKNERVSENGSLLHNRSHERSEEQKRGLEEKYKSKLQALRKDIKAKQSKINDLERMQHQQFDKNKQKILQLQLAISEKTNEIRKQQLKFKQRDYEFGQYQSKIKQLEGKVKFLTEKLEGEKESGGKLLELKTQAYEEKLRLVKGNYKQLERKQQEKTIKYNKLKSKYEKYELEASESLKRKNAQIDQLLKENNKFKAENRLLEEKININNIIETEISKNKTPGSVNQDLIEQIEMERDRISGELADKQKKCAEVAENNQRLNAEVAGLRKEGRDLRSKLEEMAREERFLREENKYAKEKIEQLTRNSQEQDESRHNYLKKQLQKSVINVKKLQKACEKYTAQRQQRKKQLQQKNKQIEGLKGNVEKLKQKRGKLQSQLHEQRQNKKRLVIDYDRRLSQCSAKEEQLVEIINYKNREGSEGNEMRDSMKGEELIIEQQAKMKFNIDTMTDRVPTDSKAVNTDPYEHHESNPSSSHHQKPIIPSELILGNDYEFDLLERSRKQEEAKVEQNPKVVNYFGDLIMAQSEEDHFQICEEGEAIERVSINIQLKQLFNILRQAIEKIFNEEDISVTTVKQLPKQLEDDFNDFISYIKQKILQIQSQNNLTFIMAEGGNQPEDISGELHEFLLKPSNEYIKLKKIIEQKQYMITSLMNEKTEQENTINEQQNVQEEGERLHLQQYSVLKNEIHEQKQALDRQQLYYESLKNILKKMMNFWIEDDDNYDDFEDNLHLITTIYKFNSKELELLKLYLKKYRQLKQIQ